MVLGNALSLQDLTLVIIVGVLAAIVYSLRILVILERRIARMDLNIESIVKNIMREELKIEQKEDLIMKRLGSGPTTKKKVVKKKVKKKTAKK